MVPQIPLFWAIRPVFGFDRPEQGYFPEWGGLDLLGLALVLAGVVAVLVWRFRRRGRRPRRRGVASHVNADGSRKRVYRTRRAARAAAREYERDFGGHMNAYRCSKGWHWHIGHRR